jgi:glutaredoxin-like YruB-family protein
MKIQEVLNHNDLIERIKSLDLAYLMLIKKGSGLSDCALNNITKVQNEDIRLFVADVSVVRDIHEKYGVNSVPALLSFAHGVFQNVVKGCNNPDFYRAFFEHTSYASGGDEETGQPAVTVYTTPTCSWCTTLKNHLRKFKIRFTEVDISQDASLADELMRKSGQQGVPQTEINGEIIVGFDKTRINKLLNIN